MEERERIEEKLKELAKDEAERERLLRLLDAAYRGLEEGMSGGVKEVVESEVGATLQALEEVAGEIEQEILRQV